MDETRLIAYIIVSFLGFLLISMFAPFSGEARNLIEPGKKIIAKHYFLPANNFTFLADNFTFPVDNFTFPADIFPADPKIQVLPHLGT